MRLAVLLGVAGEALRLPRVTLHMWGGGEESEATYTYFRRRHPRYPVVRNKEWGVALVPLPDTFDEYLGGSKSQVMRTNRSRAQRLGFRFSAFEPRERVEELLEINASLPKRQHRPMSGAYIERRAVEQWARGKSQAFGVFDAHSRLRAYAWTPVLGDAFVFSRILGHGDDLQSGIMYLLVSEVIREMISLRDVQGFPTWAMYDTFFGAAPGLRYFKERLGFRPYRVRWSWRADV